jgi:hypothetical protein
MGWGFHRICKALSLFVKSLAAHFGIRRFHTLFHEEHHRRFFLFAML